MVGRLGLDGDRRVVGIGNSGCDFVIDLWVDEAAFVSGILATLLGVTLIVVKVSHHLIRRRQQLRRVGYTESLSSVIIDGSYPLLSPDLTDRQFLHVVMEYLQLMSGEARQSLLAYVRQLRLDSSLVAELNQSSRAMARMEAAAILAEIADAEMAPALRMALDDPLPEVVVQVARGLTRLGGDDNLRAVVARLESATTPWVATRIADQLVKAGPAAVPILLEVFDHWAGRPVTEADDPVCRVTRVLGLIGDDRAERQLIELLSDPDADRRLVAASALERAGTIHCLPALMVALADPDWRVRARAAVALGGFPVPDAVEPLTRAMSDTSWWVRQDAAKGLARVPGGMEALGRVVEGHDAYARDAALFFLAVVDRSSTGRTRHFVAGSGDQP